MMANEVWQAGRLSPPGPDHPQTGCRYMLDTSRGEERVLVRESGGDKARPV